MATATQHNEEEPVSVVTPILEQPETWIDRPLTGGGANITLPEHYKGKTYKWLVDNPEGRLFLVRDALAANDAFAQAVLDLFPHPSDCTCNACGYLAGQKPKEHAPPAAAPPTPSPQPAAAGGAPPAGKKIKPKKASVAGQERAEATLDATKIAIEYEKPLEDAFRAAILEEDTTYIADSAERDSYIADANRKSNRVDRLKKLSQGIAINNGWAATWAWRTILARRDAVAEIKRQQQAIVARAERDLEYFEEVLLPKLKEYVDSIPVENRASEKSIKPPGCSGRIQLKEYADDYAVTSGAIARTNLEKELGEDLCIAIGLLKVKTELSETGLREYLLDHRELAAKIGGVKFVPKHDEAILIR